MISLRPLKTVAYSYLQHKKLVFLVKSRLIGGEKATSGVVMLSLSEFMKPVLRAERNESGR